MRKPQPAAGENVWGFWTHEMRFLKGKTLKKGSKIWGNPLDPGSWKTENNKKNLTKILEQTENNKTHLTKFGRFER